MSLAIEVAFFYYINKVIWRLRFWEFNYFSLFPPKLLDISYPHFLRIPLTPVPNGQHLSTCTLIIGIKLWLVSIRQILSQHKICIRYYTDLYKCLDLYLPIRVHFQSVGIRYKRIVFDAISSNMVRFSLSNPPLMYLLLKTLTSIIRTG